MSLYSNSYYHFNARGLCCQYEGAFSFSTAAFSPLPRLARRLTPAPAARSTAPICSGPITSPGTSQGMPGG